MVGFLGRGFNSRRLHQISPMKITVIVHKAEEGGYWADVPAIPGCATQGETMDELLANVREAVEGCLSIQFEGVCTDRDEVIELAV